MKPEELHENLMQHKKLLQTIQKTMNDFDFEDDEFLIAGGSCFRAWHGTSYEGRSDVDVFVSKPFPTHSYDYEQMVLIGTKERQIANHDGKYKDVTGLANVSKFFHVPTKTHVDIVEFVKTGITFGVDRVLNTFDMNVSKYYWSNSSQKLFHADEDTSAIVIYPRHKASFYTTYERVYKYQKLDPSRTKVYFKTKKEEKLSVDLHLDELGI